MRYTSRLAGLALLFVSLAPVRAADKAPDTRSIVTPQAQVWCGPSTSEGLYPTNVLRQGERVQVVQELDSGWLAIRPPVGSFSWINERFVQHTAAKYPNNYVVSYEGHPVSVLTGSSEVKVKPTKIGMKLERGTQVRVVGRAMTDSEGTWLPIEAPEGELRYIRKENVSKPRTLVSATVTTAASVRKEPPPPPDGDALWRDADKAERAGHLADAIRLYRLAGDANLSVNPARAEEAYRRAHWLQQANTSTNAPGDGSQFAPDRGAAAYPVPTTQAGTNAVRLIGTASPGATAGQLVSTPTASTAQGTPQTGYYRRGWLHRAYRNNENGRYHLMDERGNPIISVIAGPNVDLTSHIEHNVELWGNTSYDFDRRNYLLTVTRVREVQ